MKQIVSSKSRAVDFGAIAIAAVIGLLACPSAYAQSSDGWGKWEKNPTDGGSLRKWTGGYKHCDPARLSGKQAFVWECRPCEGAARDYQNYCWVGYSFDLMTCVPPSDEDGYRVETYYRKTQKRCGPEEQKKTISDGYDNWHEVTAKDELSSNGTAKEVPVEQPPAGSTGPEVAGGGTVPEDEKSFHKKETEEKEKAKTAKTVTPATDTGKVEKRPRKEVKRTTKIRRAKFDNGQPTSTGGGVSPEAAGAIGAAVGIGIGIGMGGGRMDDRGGMMRGSSPRGDTMH